MLTLVLHLSACCDSSSVNIIVLITELKCTSCVNQHVLKRNVKDSFSFLASLCESPKSPLLHKLPCQVPFVLRQRKMLLPLEYSINKKVKNHILILSVEGVWGPPIVTISELVRATFFLRRILLPEVWCSRCKHNVSTVFSWWLLPAKV